ncbi:MAG TPA: APC family permease [Candidatus Eisenbacteria bacterium]|nr:APC family permease [Candidatus Eisenbacteria bacterium]
MEKLPTKQHVKLNQWFATAICGNDILSSTFYVSGIAIAFAGIFAPLILLFIGVVLFFYKAVYTEVVEALPTNGGAYNCLLNASSKTFASVAGTLTILSYVATAVISGKTAIAYLHAIVNVPIIPVTIVLLLFFALLVISGIKDSAKVALGIFVFHIVVLIAFVLFGGIYYLQHGAMHFMQNITSTKVLIASIGGFIPALFFGFSTSLLGVSGYESSANFVEEQGPGVFRKTLRNMLIGVAIFNPLTALVALNVLPFDVIVNSKDFLLADVAQVMGGSVFQYIVVIDAFLVLAGAVLTAFVGVSGLIYRMTTDGCFPNVISKENSKGSYPYIIGGFFLLCTSILIITKGDLLSLAGVYTIAFLSVMSMFALGNLIMRETRSDLKRTYHAPLIFVMLAFGATVAGVIGNVRISPQNIEYFAVYFVPTMTLVFLFLKIDWFFQFLLRFTKYLRSIDDFVLKHFEDLTSGRFVVFIHHVNRLYKILDYINTNETGRNIILVHCNNGNKEQYEKSLADLKEVLPSLHKAGAFPHFNIRVVYKDIPFSPDLIDEAAKEFKVRKNRILIGSIHEEHPFDYQQLGGVRIIF